MLNLTPAIWRRSGCKRMGLAETERREAEIEVCAGHPGMMLEIEVNADYRVFVVTEVLDCCRCTPEPETRFAFPGTHVQEACFDKPGTFVETEEDESGNHPAGETVPMTPAGAKVEDSDHIVATLEELVSGPADGPGGAEDVKKCDKELSHNAKDDILFLHEGLVDFWLGLVKSAFYDCPAEGVQEGLKEDNATRPAVQEVEVLIRDTCDEGKNAFAGAECDSEWSQSVRHCSNSIREPTQTSTRIVYPWHFLHWCHPGLVDNANKSDVIS